MILDIILGVAIGVILGAILIGFFFLLPSSCFHPFQ